MGRHSTAHRSVRASSVLGAGATALTLASLLAIAQTAVLPAAGADGTSSAPGGRGTTAAMDFQLVAGPLAIPAIGVVAPGFDDWYASGPGLGLFSPPARSGSPLAASVLDSFSAIQSPSLPLSIAPITVESPSGPAVDATSPLAPAVETPATQQVDPPHRSHTRPSERTPTPTTTTVTPTPTTPAVQTPAPVTTPEKKPTETPPPPVTCTPPTTDVTTPKLLPTDPAAAGTKTPAAPTTVSCPPPCPTGETPPADDTKTPAAATTTAASSTAASSTAAADPPADGTTPPATCTDGNTPADPTKTPATPTP